MSAAATAFSPPATSLRWSVRTAVTPADEALAAKCGISPVTAAILRNRGHKDEAAVRLFLSPDASVLRDPLQLPDIELAVDRVHRAITSREPFLVFGDYDVDGVTSTALLVRSLQLLGANLTYRIPEREEGYGLSIAAVEEAHQDGIGLILTADCGITAHEPARRARELGVDLIITDHHDVGDTLPDALAVVNPKRAGSTYGFTELSGCGVAYKFVQALLSRHWPKHAASFQDRYIDLVAMAAIADCVSLTGENRYLCYEGLRRVADTRKAGLKALIQVSDLRWDGASLCGHHIGFRLAPRLNAAGRLASPRLALDLLLTKDEEEARALARQLEDLNSERQQQTRSAAAEAVTYIERHANLDQDCLTVAVGHDWNPGVVGLVASRLVDKFHRPGFAFRVHDGVAHGSGRSIDGLDLHELLESVRPLLMSGGGHAAACGLSLREQDLPRFREAALAFAATRLDASRLGPSVEADCGVEGRHIDLDLVSDLSKLEPCGIGNEAPTLALHGALLQDVRLLGQTGEHVKWRLRHGMAIMEAIWWRGAAHAEKFPLGSTVDVAFCPELNTHQGRTRVQLIIKEARHSPS